MKLNHFYQYINKQHLNTTLLDTLVTIGLCNNTYEVEQE